MTRPARDLQVTDADRNRAARQVVAKFAGHPGKEARETTAISQEMADRYVQQLNEQER